MPAHLEAISRCWDEYLLKATYGERVKLVNFLIQLHPHFPTWRLLSWESIVESMLEDDFLSGNEDEDESGVLAHMVCPVYVCYLNTLITL